MVSPTYPYQRVSHLQSMRGADALPRKVVNYLLDMPMAGYEPPDDNEYARCRLMKYLYYDDATPLVHPLPTPEEKLALVFDPERPEAPTTEKGYRIYPQAAVAQAQTKAQTILRVYMGPTRCVGEYKTELSLVFEMLSNVAYESNATALSRTWAMECAIVDALNGVNMDGVGTFYFDRTQHSSCGSEPIGDLDTNLGRRLILGLSWMGRD